MTDYIVCVGAIFIDTVLSVPKFPIEDEKLRATSHTRRRGGNCGNTLEVLTQLVSEDESYDGEEKPSLHLLAVLPEEASQDTTFIKESLADVGIMNSSLFHPGSKDAASSYIIQNAANNTRTIISHNPLPEMTVAEFVASAARLDSGRRYGYQNWYHFEGRVPQLLLRCVAQLRVRYPHFKISVECENPEREEMYLVAKTADVVFFSKLWAESKGYDNPTDFLNSIRLEMQDDAILCCTWGDKGASILHKNPLSGDEWAHVHGWRPGNRTAPVIDTIGAGDTFIAGVSNAPIRDACETFTDFVPQPLDAVRSRLP
jgi:ketohexokinase